MSESQNEQTFYILYYAVKFHKTFICQEKNKMSKKRMTIDQKIAWM